MVPRPLLELAFPPRCVVCGGTGFPWCAWCEGDVAALVPPCCARCGAPWAEPLAACARCPPRPIARLRAPFSFEGPVRRAMLALKFSGQAELADALGGAMAVAWRTGSGAEERAPPGATAPQVVTWVPLSARRRAERGFDQAEALARAVGARLDLPVVRLLVRVVDTPPQARRGAAERRRALSGAFRVVGTPPPRVLLVDDVLTTGSTALECARVLRPSGVRRMEALVAARALAGPLPPRCYTSGDLSSGSVVARGSSSIVDASRRRNDPRKATLGR